MKPLRQQISRSSISDKASCELLAPRCLFLLLSSVAAHQSLRDSSSGYNPPPFILNAAKDALDRVDCNQYSPTQGRLRLREALSASYSPFWGRKLNPVDEIVITSGANEGMLSAFMGFIEPGDEVIVMEPYFDQYISNIEMAGGKVWERSRLEKATRRSIGC